MAFAQQILYLMRGHLKTVTPLTLGGNGESLINRYRSQQNQDGLLGVNINDNWRRRQAWEQKA